MQLGPFMVAACRVEREVGEREVVRHIARALAEGGQREDRGEVFF